MNEEPATFFHSPGRNDVLLVLLTGIVVSIISFILAWIVSSLLIAGAICGDSNNGVCAEPFTLSYNIFLIIGALAATTWFVYGRIFRPALVALPPIIVFWSLPAALPGLVDQGMPVFGLVSVVLITLSYLAFYWIVRVSNFFAALILWLVVVIGLRLFLVI